MVYDNVRHISVLNTWLRSGYTVAFFVQVISLWHLYHLLYRMMLHVKTGKRQLSCAFYGRYGLQYKVEVEVRILKWKQYCNCWERSYFWLILERRRCPATTLDCIQAESESLKSFDFVHSAEESITFFGVTFSNISSENSRERVEIEMFENWFQIRSN